MKINEIITEGELKQSAKRALPGLKLWPDLDNGNVPYLQYRFGIALAGSPDLSTPPVGPVAGQLVTTSYTDAEEEIIAGAAKEMGVKPVKKTDMKSNELENVNKVSPVAPKKKNKYGV